MIPPPPVQLRARCHTSIYSVICMPELMLCDFGGRSISLSVRPRPVHQLAPEPSPEAKSAILAVSKANEIFLLCPVWSHSGTSSTPARQQRPAGPRQTAPPAHNCQCACLARRGPVLAQVRRRRLCPARINPGVRPGHSPLTSARSSGSPHEQHEAAWSTSKQTRSASLPDTFPSCPGLCRHTLPHS